jgi:hypothetical protein
LNLTLDIGKTTSFTVCADDEMWCVAEDDPADLLRMALGHGGASCARRGVRCKPTINVYGESAPNASGSSARRRECRNVGRPARYAEFEVIT